MRLLALILCFLAPGLLSAGSCIGTDLRPSLSPADTAEIDTRLENVPFLNGNHWTARKGKDLIHVIGTMHISDPRMDDLAEDLAPLIRKADQLIVEMTPERQGAFQQLLVENPSLGFITEGPTLIDMLTPEQWAPIKAAAEARGLPSFMAAKYKPWFLSLTLAIPPCALRDQQAGLKGLDHRLMDIATAAGTPMQSLDRADILLDIFAKDPIDLQLEYLLLAPLDLEQARNQFVTMAELYFEENAFAAIETGRILARPHFPDPDEFDRLYDEVMFALLDKRNTEWLPMIAQARGTTVVAVGSAHLGGKQGLLKLLEDSGYTLERQPF
jgi:uncharacterized protein YbaP (TraB family)